MAVSMAQVKELRDITNAGMLDCKKALEASNGNIDEAMKILREKGLADAKKRSDRETKEGGVYVGTKDGKVAIALVACETDFVANNAQFKDACNELVGKIIDKGSENADDYKEDLQHIAQITKENVNVKKLKCLNVADNQYVSTYIHGNNQIGVVVVYEMADKAVAEKAEFADMAKNVALHVAAEAQKLGGIAAFIDAEHALDPQYAKNLGVNIDELWVSQPDTGEQALEIADTLVRSGALDVLVVDSVAALVPKAELEGEMGDSHMGLQARLMSQALRKITASVSSLSSKFPSVKSFISNANNLITFSPYALFMLV